MPTPSSAEARKAGLRGWATITGTLALAYLWVWFAPLPALADWPPLVAICVTYLALFVPLILLAVLAGRLGAVAVVRAGDQPGRWAATGFGIGLFALLGSVALSWLNGGLIDAGDAGTSAVLALAVLLVLLQVSAEEVLFRGWLQQALADRLGPWPAIGIAAVLFTGLHYAAQAPLALLNITLAGVLFGLLAWRSGGLPAAIAAHFAYNAAEDIGLGLFPNPGPGELGSVVNLDLVGLASWGGQFEGLNASVGTTAALLACIVPLAWYRSAPGPGMPATPQPVPASR